MKTPKKVIEKISLPLMFVTFVMAVLMFAVSPVSAAPVSCDPNFCDQDNDDYFKDHKRCPTDCEGSKGIDCDDSNPLAPADPGACDGVVSDGDIYTAQLTDGAFIFVDDLGVPITAPIEVITDSNQSIGLVPLEDDVEMWRPTDTDDQATWDRMFYNGCPNLGTAEAGQEGFKITKIKSTYNDWSIEEPGNYRLILRDIQLTAGGVDWDVTMQLIGEEHYDPYPDGWLPTDEDPHFFVLTRGRMWGREIRGGPGGRMSCYSNGSDIGVFDLDVSDIELKIAIP